MDLNLEQQKAVNSREGVYAVIAGPGSGKTRVLVERFRALVESGIDPSDILSVTFTSKAAEEMRVRATGQKKHQQMTPPSGFRTFHSLALAFAMSEGAYFPYQLEPMPLVALVNKDGVERHITAQSIARNVAKWYPGMNYRDLAAYVSKQKRNEISPDDSSAIDFEHMHLVRAYGDYQERLTAQGILDYDDLILFMEKILTKNEQVRQRWQYRFLQIDESQDCDQHQWNIVRLVSATHRNIFAVGDGNQCIFSWRTAQPEYFINFHEMFPEAQYLYLGTNYRSSPQIVNYVKANAPIKNELIERFKPVMPDAFPVQISSYSTQGEEADSVITTATGLSGESAVLARTNQYLAAFEQYCIENEIRFYNLAGSGFWKSSEIQNTIRFYKKYKSPETDINTIIADLKRRELQYREEEDATADNDPGKNMAVLAGIAARFSNLGEFLVYANRASHASRKIKNAIALGTVHAAKGLEWNNVFVVGAQEGILPHKNSEDLEEEARIFFVAISRPQRFLHISYYGIPSRFIDDAHSTSKNNVL
jgi:ATP-dependent DNA helicase UvrD/PcrA